MIEKHYGDARVDGDQLDEMIGEFESATGNLPGTLPNASDDSLPSKVKEPFVFYGVPTRAGDRGRPVWESVGHRPRLGIGQSPSSHHAHVCRCLPMDEPDG
jgi:hypothetical protein